MGCTDGKVKVFGVERVVDQRVGRVVLAEAFLKVWGKKGWEGFQATDVGE